jgi:hypothetical protein
LTRPTSRFILPVPEEIGQSKVLISTEGYRTHGYSTAVCAEVAMRRSAGVGVVLLLGLGMFATPTMAQSSSSTRDRGFQLQQNFPNPFNPETTIPFDLFPAMFESGKPVVVTIRIFNVLHQPVAIPTALNHPAGNGTAVENLEYASPGTHLAYWNGLDRDGRKVASGLYYVLLEVNGRRATPIKITVAK